MKAMQLVCSTNITLVKKSQVNIKQIMKNHIYIYIYIYMYICTHTHTYMAVFSEPPFGSLLNQTLHEKHEYN